MVSISVSLGHSFIFLFIIFSSSLLTSDGFHKYIVSLVGFSMDRTIQSDDCSYSMVVLSHPGINSDHSEI